MNERAHTSERQEEAPMLTGLEGAFVESEHGREAMGFAGAEMRVLAERGSGIVRRAPEHAGKIKQLTRRFALATMVAASLNGVLAGQAEAGQRRGRHVATGVSVGARVLEDIWASKSREHAEMARDLDRMERRFKLLTQQVDAIHERLVVLREALKDPALSRWRRGSIQREFDGLTRKQMALLAELEELAAVLDSVGTTAAEEAKKAQKDAMKADVARTIGEAAEDIRRGW
ncbi:MAG: hypothetical protein IT406_04125 [Candidatus Yanofskybacteria bacterium]|nr:hypothetical protein [Candidatus Yanofskybacteria bacterium]